MDILLTLTNILIPVSILVNILLLFVEHKLNKKLCLIIRLITAAIFIVGMRIIYLSKQNL